jgi:hypothetical protein
MKWNRKQWIVMVEWPSEEIPICLSAAMLLLCLLTLGWTLAGGSHAVLWGLLIGDGSLFLATCATALVYRLHQPAQPATRSTPPRQERPPLQAEDIAAREEEINLHFVGMIREMGFVPWHNRWICERTGEEARPEEVAWLTENFAGLRELARDECAIKRRLEQR